MIKDNIKEIRIREKKKVLFTVSNVFLFLISVLFLILAVGLYCSYYYLEEIETHPLILICILLSAMCLGLIGLFFLTDIESDEREVIRTLEVLNETKKI